MKIVGIGTQLSIGRVISISRDSVVVVDNNNRKVNVTFRIVENKVFGG
jgi:uncharacterized UPF0146 family protein